MLEDGMLVNTIAAHCFSLLWKRKLSVDTWVSLCGLSALDFMFLRDLWALRYNFFFPSG